jgi:hypothetical protein
MVMVPLGTLSAHMSRRLTKLVKRPSAAFLGHVGGLAPSSASSSACGERWVGQQRAVSRWLGDSGRGAAVLQRWWQDASASNSSRAARGYTSASSVHQYTSTPVHQYTSTPVRPAKLICIACGCQQQLLAALSTHCHCCQHPSSAARQPCTIRASATCSACSPLDATPAPAACMRLTCV